LGEGVGAGIYLVAGADLAYITVPLCPPVGPTLTNFNGSPVSNNPQLAIFNSSGQEIEIGQKWSLVTSPNPISPDEIPQSQFDAQAMGWIFNLAGAFPLTQIPTTRPTLPCLPQEPIRSW
jgi:hypothetical protein